MTTSAEPSTPSGSPATQQRRRQITSYKNTTSSPATNSALVVATVSYACFYAACIGTHDDPQTGMLTLNLNRRSFRWLCRAVAKKVLGAP